LFGGQAEATTESLSGKIDQMKNAFGDLQEVMGAKLAPIVQDMVVGFTDLISVNLSDELKKESQEFKDLTDILLDTNSATSSRKIAINELKSSYSDYLGDLDIEKASLKEIEKLQLNQIAVLEKRIEQQLFEEELKDIIEERIKAEKELFEASKNKNDIEVMNSGNVIELGKIRHEIAKNQLEDLLLEEEAMRKNQMAFQNRNKVIVEGNNNVTDGLKEQGSWRRKLGAISKQETLDQGRTEYQTALSGAKAHLLAQIMKTPFPLNLLLAAGVESQVDKLFAKNDIKAFATGADYVTSGPEMIMVGDNASGKEHVQITPLGGDPAPNAPQNGINLTFNNAIMTQDFVEGELLDSIKEGLRLGGDIGIN
jgi:hypothetical protein